MNSEKVAMSKKKIVIISVSALVAISALIFVFIWLFNSGKDLKIVFNDGEKYNVFSYENMSYNSFEIGENNKKAELKITNKNEEITEIGIMICNEENVVLDEQVQLEKGKCVIDLNQYPKGVYDISIRIIQNQEDKFLVAGEKNFEKIISTENVTDKTVLQLTDLTFDELNITYPFIWNTNNKKCEVLKDIVFVSENEGFMKILNSSADDILAENVFCDTPKWDYEIGVLFNNFCEEEYYYVKALSVNGAKIDTTKMQFDSLEEVNRFSDDGVLNLEDQVANIVFNGDYDLGKITFNRPVNVEFKGDIKATSVNFAFLDEAAISIITDNNITKIAKNIDFNTPNTDVTITGADLYTNDYIEQYMNVKSYNGVATDINIGGEGEARISEATANDVAFLFDGNFAFIKCTYSNYVNLDKPDLDVSVTNDGTCEIVKNEGKYYLVTTDKNDKKFGYKITMDMPNYTLPVVYITTSTGENVKSKTEYIEGTFSIDYNGSEAFENIYDAKIQIRGRGNSTWKLDKKPYKIKFDSKNSLFGFEEAKDWVLLANHVDRSLIRNTVALEMSKVLDNLLFVPSSYPVDVFVNGEYQGVYSLGQQVEMKKGRIEGTADKNSTDIDTDYLIEWGGGGDVTSFGDNTFGTNMHMSIEVKNPDAEIITQEQFDYISKFIVETDKAVEALEGYEDYLDIPSLIDWFLIYEFSYNTDGIFRRSDFFMKKQGGKLFAATPWDFDYAFGNFYMDPGNPKGWICLGNSATDAYEGKYIKPNWITYLLNDENFKQQLKARWEEVGEDMYNIALQTIDEMQAKIGLSADENFTVWDKCLGVKVQYESWRTRELTTYEEQIEFLRTFIENRYKWMDETIKGM
ncbi:MAG: CotH kinase family protein [Lachnospiraceae bacterium]|nr:CotH kinase family protein [Lachnospiraceae bacterium]